MTDTENEQSSSDTTLSTADAFALVGHEIRAEIFRVFWTTDGGLVIPFGDIRSRMTVDVEPSRLHYHLDQLVGHYLDRTEDGYRLRPEGIRLVLTVIGRPFDREQESMLLDPNFDCHTCQKPAKARLGTDDITIWCEDCDTVYGYDFLIMPIEAFGDGPETFSFSHYSKYISQKLMSIASGVCPNCAHPLQAKFRSANELPYDRKAVIDHSCALCMANWAVWAGQALLADPVLRSFCADHGVDLLSTPYWELEFVATDEYLTVRSTDPWEIVLEVTLDDETLELVVDDNVDIIERNRMAAAGDGIVLPDKDTCTQKLRRHRWPDGVTCPNCSSPSPTREGKTSKDIQRYKCKECTITFNDLTGTVFADQQLTIPEMFHIVRKMDETEKTNIAQQLDRSYRSVLDFVHKVQDLPDDEFAIDLDDVCESVDA